MCVNSVSHVCAVNGCEKKGNHVVHVQGNYDDPMMNAVGETEFYVCNDHAEAIKNGKRPTLKRDFGPSSWGESSTTTVTVD